MIDQFARENAGELSRLVGSFEQRVWDPAKRISTDRDDLFDIKSQAVMPVAWFQELRTPVADDLSETDRIRLGNEIVRWLLSGILYGERAAASLCRQLQAEFTLPVAKTYAANQAREEDRHEAAFGRYLGVRWGSPVPAGEAFTLFLQDLLKSARLGYKVVGMSVLVEGFAMGALSNIRAHTNDPILAEMLSLVLRDESIHHSFGALWLEEKAAVCRPEEWADLQRFAARGFDVLCVNLLSIRQRREAYRCVGLNWHEVRTAVQKLRRDSTRGPGLEEGINPLRVVAANLDRYGLISETDRPRLQRWLQ